MKLLLDTHVLLWWQEDRLRLRPRVRELIGDPHNQVLVSVASYWELSIKARKGDFERSVAAIWQDASDEGFEALGITSEQLLALRNLPFVNGHNDPFDHLILAQGKAERAVVVTGDRKMIEYGIPCIGVK